MHATTRMGHDNIMVKWRRPATTDHVLYDSIYMKCKEQVNLQRQKVDYYLPRERL